MSINTQVQIEDYFDEIQQHENLKPRHKQVKYLGRKEAERGTISNRQSESMSRLSR